MDVKVSVVIPVYKVEKYIERCADSLFAQTLKELEFIFVDDCTPDNSIEIIKRVLKKYPQRANQVKFISHEMNQGIAKSRLDGIDQATGEYIIHCDSDDWVEPDMYDCLYSKAIDANADIAVCDFYEETQSAVIVRHQAVFENKKDLFKAVLEGNLHAAFWNKLVKREFLMNCPYKIPKEIFMWDDMAVIVPVLLKADRIVKLDKALYHYMLRRAGSITATYDSRKTDSMLRCVGHIEEYLKQAGLYESLKIQLYELILRASSGLISQKCCWNPELWKKKNENNTIGGILRSNIRWTHKIYAIFVMLGLESILKIRFGYSR